MEKQEDHDVNIAGVESLIYKEIKKMHSQHCQPKLGSSWSAGEL